MCWGLIVTLSVTAIYESSTVLCHPSLLSTKDYQELLCRKSQDSVYFLLSFFFPYQILFIWSGCLMSNLIELNVLNIFSRNLMCLNIMSFYSTILWKILFLSIVSFPTNSVDQSEKKYEIQERVNCKNPSFLPLP
jgi:hypothetical protein